MKDENAQNPGIEPQGNNINVPEEGVIEILSEGGGGEDRYSRLKQLGWDRERLQNAYALVVGAGALGNEVLKNLALMGWGHIIVVDLDTIEDSNLTRSVLFRHEDVGRQSYKSVVAARRAQEINPDVQILPVVGTVQDCIGLGAYRRVDVVFGCLDNRQARLDVGISSWKTWALYIDGGLDGVNGDVQTFMPPNTACYGCTISPLARNNLRDRHPCLKVKVNSPKPLIPTAPTISSIVAGWQVQIAVKYLHGKKIPFGERIAIFGLPDQVERYCIPSVPDCLDHTSCDFILNDDVIELPFKSAEITLGDLASHIQSDMGPETMIEFDFDLLVKSTCVNCDIEKIHYRRLSIVNFNEILCPNCGSIMHLESDHQFDGKEPYASRTLADLGVPPLHILRAKNWERRLSKYYELSLDFGDFFRQNSRVIPKFITIQLLLPNGDNQSMTIPAYLPLQEILDFSADEWGISEPLSNWEFYNNTRNVIYGVGESLASYDIMLNDQLCIRRKTVEEPFVHEIGGV